MERWRHVRVSYGGKELSARVGGLFYMQKKNQKIYVNKANMRRGLDIPARAIHIDRYQTHSTFSQPSILKLKPLRILMTQPDENLSQKKTFSSRNNDSTEIRHRVQNQ